LDAWLVQKSLTKGGGKEVKTYLRIFAPLFILNLVLQFWPGRLPLTTAGGHIVDHAFELLGGLVVLPGLLAAFIYGVVRLWKRLTRKRAIANL
jgi:hypothetical protein